MTLGRLLYGEHAQTKVAALFTSRRQAAAAARRLHELVALDAPQLLVVGPPDDTQGRPVAFARQCAAMSRLDWHCLVRLYLVGGAAGALAGLLLDAGFVAAARPVVVAAPQLALIAIVTFSALIGMMLAGLVGLRPDHLRVVAAVRRAVRQGRWAVVVHSCGDGQATQVLNELEARSYRVVRSL